MVCTMLTFCLKQYFGCGAAMVAVLYEQGSSAVCVYPPSPHVATASDGYRHCEAASHVVVWRVGTGVTVVVTRTGIRVVGLTNTILWAVVVVGAGVVTSMADTAEQQSRSTTRNTIQVKPRICSIFDIVEAMLSYPHLPEGYINYGFLFCGIYVVCSMFLWIFLPGFPAWNSRTPGYLYPCPVFGWKPGMMAAIFPAVKKTHKLPRG
jgi:hypothetical protein